MGINDEQSQQKLMRIIPYHISILLAECDKDAYGALMEAASDAGSGRPSGVSSPPCEQS